MGDRPNKTDSRKTRQAGANPFDFEPPNPRTKGISNAPASPNPFDADEDESAGSVKSSGTNSSKNNPFGNSAKSVNPFDFSEESSNPFDDHPTPAPTSNPVPASRRGSSIKQQEDGSNPFDEPKPHKPTTLTVTTPPAALTRLSHSESSSAIKGRMSHSESSLSNVSGPKSPALNPFDEESSSSGKPVLHMIPPREVRSSSVVVPPFIEGEVSCVILASCTSYQIMKNPKEHAVYTLTITATLSMKNAVPFSWSVKRRNKQFETLHASLSQTLDTSLLPPLPKKTWTRSLEPAYLETRRQAFDRYIQAVIAEYGENTIVCTWLCDSFHKMLLPFLHKQMEDRVTTDQLRHHLSAAVIREHDLEEKIDSYVEREKEYVETVAKKENERVLTAKKSEEYKNIAERAHNECDTLRQELRTQKQANETLTQQMKTLQEELEHTIKKLNEKPPPPPTTAPAPVLPSPLIPSPLSPAPTPATSLTIATTSATVPDRKASLTEPSGADRKLSITNPFDDQTTQRKLSVGGSNSGSSGSGSSSNQTNMLSPSSALVPTDPASIIEFLDKPLFEPQQVQWICVSCATENKLPIVQCVSCRLVKPLSFPIELTITNIHKVQRNAKEDPFAEYLLQVKFGTFCYLVRRRFSDFEKLHDNLIAFFGKLETMPSLPKASLSMFGGQAQSFDPVFLQQRRTQLQAFLHGIVKHSLFFHCGPLCGWLVLDSVDGLFGPLLRAASTQRVATEQLAEHVRELEATVSTKTQLLVETLELRNRLEEALETEKAKFAQLTVMLEAASTQLEEQRVAMQNQQHSSESEIQRLQVLIAEQTRKTEETRASLEERVAELTTARGESERLAQETETLTQQIIAERAMSVSLEQQLESALSRSTEIARELAAVELKVKQAEERAAVQPPPPLVSDGRSSASGVADEYCVVSPPLSPTQKSSSPLTVYSSVPSSPDTMALPKPVLVSNDMSSSQSVVAVDKSPDVDDSQLILNAPAQSELVVEHISQISTESDQILPEGEKEHQKLFEGEKEIENLSVDHTATSFHLPPANETEQETESTNPFD